MLAEAVIQPSEGNPWLGGRGLGLRVDLNDIVKPLFKIENDRFVDRLARQARPTTARENGNFVVRTVAHDCLYIGS